jgi:transketolase
VIDRKKFAPASLAKHGAYVLAESASGKPELILIATGSEVSLALQAWEKLDGHEIATRVVSMPSWEIYREQPDDYREQVLPSHIWARIAIEAASPFGWKEHVGDRGIVIGMESFGASAPFEINMDQFGFNVENVVSKAKALLSGSTVIKSKAV